MNNSQYSNDHITGNTYHVYRNNDNAGCCREFVHENRDSRVNEPDYNNAGNTPEK